MSVPEALPPPRLVARGVTLTRGDRVLFSGLDFVVRPGTMLILRGPNGAGKTSLLLALAGALSPGAGRIAYGEDGGDPPAAPHLHLLLVHNAIKPRLSVAENLDFWRALNGPTGLAAAAALERVGLAGLAPIEAGHLSTGQQRRLALARLLVSRRPLWLLDEPTAALDSDGETLVGALLADHCAAGGSAVVATHQRLATDAASATLTLSGATATLEPRP